MPGASLTIDQQIERRMAEIRHKGRRHDSPGTGPDSLTAGERREHMPRKIMPVPRAEEGRRANDERAAGGGEHPPLRLRLAAAIGADGADRILLAIVPRETAVEDKIR